MCTQPTEANAVFAVLPAAAAERLRDRFRFYDWSAPRSTAEREVRWMCSFDTTEDDVDAFLTAIALETIRGRGPDSAQSADACEGEPHERSAAALHLGGEGV